MDKPVVGLTSFEDAYASVSRVLDLCGGLDGLRPADRILIKPNLVEWDLELPFPPWGVVTTSAVVGALVRVLAEWGARQVVIGEGTPLPHVKGKGQQVYRLLGYELLRDRYGVELVDLDEEPFEEVDLGDIQLSVAQRALNADKIITVPALKTHGICRVSLGIKNLKGCINRRSKKYCHHPDLDLDQTFPQLLKKLPVALNLIDGVYALERGPTQSGRGYRKDVLVASTDVLAGDVVGANLLGYELDEIPHLQHHAQAEGRLEDMQQIEVRGETVADHAQRLEWDTPWREDNTGPTAFDKMGIHGLAFTKPDHSLCTNCVCVMAPTLVMLMTAYNRETCGTVEVITGKKTLARQGFDKTLLLGRCASKLNADNPNIQQKIALKTCPPDLDEFVRCMNEAGVPCDFAAYEQFRQRTFARYKEADGFSMAMYSVSDAGSEQGPAECG